MLTRKQRAHMRALINARTRAEAAIHEYMIRCYQPKRKSR